MCLNRLQDVGIEAARASILTPRDIYLKKYVSKDDKNLLL